MKRLCDLLAATPLFEGLTHDVYHETCTKTNIRVAWKGEILFNEGDTCTGIGLIVEGQVAIQKYSLSGDYTTLELLGAGEMFGENLIFGSRKLYPNTLEAVTNAKIIFVTRESLLGMIAKSPQLLHNFLRLLSDRVQQQNKRINLLSQKSLRQKISCYLLELLQEQLERDGETLKSASQIISTQAVELPVSKEVIARLLAMPRPSFSRELISMERDGLIRVSGRVIWLLNIESLQSGLVDGFTI